MTYAIRFLMAWFCFGVGVAAYRFGDLVHDVVPEWMGGAFLLKPTYALYVRAVGWSDWWQGDTSAGPWSDVDDTQEY